MDHIRLSLLQIHASQIWIRLPFLGWLINWSIQVDRLDLFLWRCCRCLRCHRCWWLTNQLIIITPIKTYSHKLPCKNPFNRRLNAPCLSKIRLNDVSWESREHFQYFLDLYVIRWKRRWTARLTITGVTVNRARGAAGRAG